MKRAEPRRMIAQSGMGDAPTGPPSSKAWIPRRANSSFTAFNVMRAAMP